MDMNTGKRGLGPPGLAEMRGAYVVTDSKEEQ
jgi:hypothetical protein